MQLNVTDAKHFCIEEWMQTITVKYKNYSQKHWLHQFLG